MMAIPNDLNELRQRIHLELPQFEFDRYYQVLLDERQQQGITRLPSARHLVRWFAKQQVLSTELAQEILSEMEVELTGLNVITELKESYFFSFSDTPTETIDTDIKKQNLADSIPTYTLIKQIGAGAMGSVHLAKDRFLRRTVAFKQLLKGIETDASQDLTEQSSSMTQGADLRFLGEAQITSQLDHPHVIPIYGLASQNGNLAYTMKMIQGQSLKQWLTKAKQNPTQREYQVNARLRLFLKICDALAFAHSKGVIHRDLKPANVMLGPYGEVYVMDWGIARPFEFHNIEIDYLEIYQQEAGQIVGTPRYMSPEQAAGLNDQLDQRSDLYAMGLILFEMLTFQAPLQAPDIKSMLVKAIRAQREPIVSVIGEKIPPSLQAIINKATARRRAERYNQISELAADLRSFLQGLPVSVYQETLLERSQRWLNHHRHQVLPVIMALMLIGGVVVLGMEAWRQSSMIQADLQRQQINLLLNALSQQAQKVSGKFQLIESHLQSISAATQVALPQTATPAESKIYFASDFQSASSAPPDWLEAPATQRRLSFDWPVIKLAPATNDRYLSRLMSLRHTFFRVFVSAHQAGILNLPRQQQIKVLREQADTIQNVYVGFANGVHLSYPGKGGYAPDYDPRLRPWYQLALQKNMLQWASPFQDALGQGAVITCVQPIKDRQNHLLAVAGIELSLEQLRQHWLPIPDRTDIQKVFLLNQEQAFVAAYPNNDPKELNLTTETAKKIQLQASGFLKLSDQQYLAWNQLEHPGWKLIVTGKWQDLMQFKVK